MNVKFLIPLGLLGLLGIVALILIYIIKPNFQQKLLSSTFLWRLSLKFKKKKMMNQLMNCFQMAYLFLIKIILCLLKMLCMTIYIVMDMNKMKMIILY